MKIQVIFHSADNDGWMSAAIIYREYFTTWINFIATPWNYGQPLPKIVGDEVYIVDLSSADLVAKAVAEAHKVIWIDHHKTSLDIAIQAPNLTKVIDTSTAASELTWKYFNEESPPKVIQYLAAWDSWRKDRFPWEEVEAVEMGCRAVCEDLDDYVVYTQPGPSSDKESFDHLRYVGWIVLNYLHNHFKKLADRVVETHFLGHKALAINSTYHMAKVVQRYVDKHNPEYDLIIVYSLKQDALVVSLYSDKIDVSAIAKSFGGGGHKGAAGFGVTDENKICTLLQIFRGKE